MKKTKRGEVISKSEGFVYQLDQLHSDVLDLILSAKEGTYGIEQLNQEIRVFVPNIERLPYKTIENTWGFFESELNAVTFYELQLRNPIFLPLYHKDSVDLLSFPNVFTQILIKKVNSNWRDSVISQYEEYLKGNDYPSTSKLIRSVQGMVLSGLSKFSNFNMTKQPIPDAEEKILSPNFKVEIRFVVDNSGQFEKCMNEQLKKLSYYNELDLVRVDKQILPLIKDREFQSFLNNQMSEQEVRCLLGTGTPIIKREVEINKVPPPPRQTDSNNVLSLLPLGVDSNRDIDDVVAKQLVNSFKRTKITNKQLKVNSVNRGATLQKITLTIPSDVLYTNIEKNLKNLQASLGNDAISMEIGDVPDTIDFYVPCDKRDIVYLRNILSTPEIVEYVKSATLPLILGEDSIGEPLMSDLAELKHILIAGATGAGKSVFLNALILTMIMYKSPSELQLILIDPKQVELVMFEQFPHTAKFVSDVDKASGTFEMLIDEMENRYSLMVNKGVRNIAQYNKKVKNKLPYIVCVVDELSDLMDTNGKEVEGYIIRLAQKARAAGIHLILCTQKPSVDVITSRIKSNLPSAISFRLKTQSDYRTVFGRNSPFNLMGNGDGVAMIEGNKKEFVRFQSPIIDIDEGNVTNILEQMADNYDGVDKYEFVEKESQLDQLKRIIACTNETRVSALREVMGVRINVVQDLVKQLADEGWLVKEGKGYKIAVDESVLGEWKI